MGWILDNCPGQVQIIIYNKIFIKKSFEVNLWKKKFKIIKYYIKKYVWKKIISASNRSIVILYYVLLI